MDILITEKQLRKLVKSKGEVKEDESGPDPQPKAGTSSQQSGGQGYPQVNKWESGVTRGPANQVGVTKWADVVGSSLKRDKANQLKEQGPMGLPHQWQIQASIGLGEIFGTLYDEYPIIMPVAASVVAAFFTGGGSLLLQAAVQLAVQAPFIIHDIKKEDYYGATLSLVLSCIPFATHLTTIKPLLKSLPNAGNQLIKKLLMLKNKERIGKYLQTLKPDSSEYILLQKLMSYTPQQFAEIIGEGISKNIDNLIKSGKIDIAKMPLKNRIWFKELMLSLKIAVPSGFINYFYEKELIKKQYDASLPKDPISIRVLEMIDKIDSNTLTVIMVNVLQPYETKYLENNPKKYTKICYNVLIAHRNNPRVGISYLQKIAATTDKTQNSGYVYR